MRGRRGINAAMTAVLVAVVAAVVVSDAPPAAAAIFTPSPDPTVDGAPGSLRAAVNAAANGDQINLVAGATYTLTCAGGGQLVRGSGSYTFKTPSGAPATIRQTCAGERVIEQSALILPTNMLTFDNVIVTGGDFEAPLSGGDALGGAVSGIYVTVTNSTFRGNTATARVGSGPSARGGAIHTYGEVTVTGSTFTGNAAIVPDGVANTDNVIGGYGGAISAELGATVTESTFTDNSVTVGTPEPGSSTVRAFGGAIDVNDLSLANASTMTVTRSTFTGNSVTAADGWAGGGALSGAGTVATPGVVAIDSTFTGNRATATTGMGGFGGAMWDQFILRGVQATNSTITDNTASTGGGGLAASAVTTTYATVVGNSAPTGANVSVFGANRLNTFASVFANPVGGDNCDVGTPTSSGYNFADDSSCNFTATGDLQSAGDPMLAALADYGGPTETRLPLTGSPLIDAIPNASCETAPLATGITSDQRSFARPSPTAGACDIGAVERQPLDVDPSNDRPEIVVTFTG